jgi:heat shock protein HtpX
VTLQQQIRANRWRTAVVLLGFGLLIAVFVLVIAAAYKPGVAGFVGIIAIVYGIISWFASGRMIAAASGAHKVEKADQPELYRTLENVAIAAGRLAPPTCT